MIDTAANTPAWVLLFMGIYALAAAIGELRAPGFWARMVGELNQSRALQFLTGLLCIVLGAAIYLTNPWSPSDWMSVVVALLGGWIVIEGALILAFGDLFMKFAARLMGAASMLWAGLSALIGVAAIIAALLRL